MTTATLERLIEDALRDYCARCDSCEGVRLARQRADLGLLVLHDDWCDVCWDRRQPLGSTAVSLILAALETQR